MVTEQNGLLRRDKINIISKRCAGAYCLWFQFEDFFWIPLPEHAWSQYSPTELLLNETIAHNPLGWGPYVMDEWVEGEYVEEKGASLFQAGKEFSPPNDWEAKARELAAEGKSPAEIAKEVGKPVPKVKAVIEG